MRGRRRERKEEAEGKERMRERSGGEKRWGRGEREEVEKKGTGRGGREDEENREIEGIIVVLEMRLPVQVTLLSHEVIQKWTVTAPCDQRPRKNKAPLEQ